MPKLIAGLITLPIVAIILAVALPLLACCWFPARLLSEIVAGCLALLRAAARSRQVTTVSKR